LNDDGSHQISINIMTNLGKYLLIYKNNLYLLLKQFQF